MVPWFGSLAKDYQDISCNMLHCHDSVPKTVLCTSSVAWRGRQRPRGADTTLPFQQCRRASAALTAPSYGSAPAIGAMVSPSKAKKRQAPVFHELAADLLERIALLLAPRDRCVA